MTTNLATFVDRYTMRHVRVYMHPVDRVWDAITDDEHVSKWMGFPVTFDVRPGGKCVWGPPSASYFETEIGRLEPKTLIEHVGVGPEQGEGYMLFELSEHADGCRFDFTQHFAPGGKWETIPGDPGGDLPGGPGTPWRPGFVGGFHDAFDALGRVLDGVPAEEGPEPRDSVFGSIVDIWLDQKVREGEFTREVADGYAKQLRGFARWNDFNEIYREHISRTIPAE